MQIRLNFLPASLNQEEVVKVVHCNVRYFQNMLEVAYLIPLRIFEEFVQLYFALDLAKLGKPSNGVRG